MYLLLWLAKEVLDDLLAFAVFHLSFLQLVLAFGFSNTPISSCLLLQNSLLSFSHVLLKTSQFLLHLDDPLFRLLGALLSLRVCHRARRLSSRYIAQRTP